MFSNEEKKIILDKEFFVSKKNITQKIYIEFEEIKKAVEENLNQHYAFIAPEILSTGKINRGENLNGLPWVNLDYPGYFKKQNVFALRYLFWWGTHFSITLHLGGECLNQFRTTVLKNIIDKKYHDFYWCLNSTPWHYDYSEQNYCLIKNLSQHQIQNSVVNNFIKISSYFELNELKNFRAIGIESAEKLLQLISKK